MKLEEYASYDGLGLAALVRRGEVSAGEVAETAQRAIDAVNPTLNAVIGRIEPQPPAADRSAPFCGVPFLIKDLVLHSEGVACDMGSRLVAGAFVSPHDTDLMQRFKAAGVVSLGRTSTPEFGFCSTTEPVLYGPTRNPWDTGRSPGGSSGGSAAAVAAGIVPVAHANDGGGSIRIPAACCGLVGLKPTRGRTPVGPESGYALHGLGIEHVVSRTVRDSAAMLDAVQGPGVGDPFEIAPPQRRYAEEVGAPTGRLRVAVSLSGMINATIDEDIRDEVMRVARHLESLGHHVTEASPAFDEASFHAANMTYWCGFLAAGVLGAAQLTGRKPSRETLEATTLACYEYGASLKMTDLETADVLANAVCRSVAPFFREFDVLLTPTTTGAALPLGFINADDPALGAKGWYDRLFRYAPFTALYNMTGQPAISLPLAVDAKGLPVGMQFVARSGAEDVLLRLAGQLEQSLPWAGRRPRVHVAA
ncbi:amidase [Bradyrhizobium sp. U87765 SZCCT0131]|uniref:amidase n=1 Tax=unclassified Bradyrhizobium TaxID=2631580 RepID=UPI001BA79760|nr:MULTISPECIES: amidase family protein [unclassified Bradyrhizobium]MBR1221136.1 amidase [Bradyrhizobium sp. U87765 SZCCT0131]MBR1260044.1 amidase [Bradyrhizobium sp. U87765 SZCCT0134]MBR1307707.1 amidase [Bradyrhizobium sp. U87765 SZCCT0110]MBR1321661.1 amidase [Bradyrhizobium sp. U87765 SZCCT0109]MBR1349974.1 amidase [Bradyrhizobium sp. U87765 SZCCT0048]